jgi:ketosteroid isomerase-like protein
MADFEKSIDRVLESYKAAVLAKDAKALIRLYDPRARVFDTWAVWSYENAEAWERAVEAWFMSLGAERVKVSFDDVRREGSVEMASVSAIVTYASQSAQGELLQAMQNRITWVLRTTGHVLRIIHEHTSAPINVNDSKAILKR